MLGFYVTLQSLISVGFIVTLRALKSNIIVDRPDMCFQIRHPSCCEVTRVALMNYPLMDAAKMSSQGTAVGEILIALCAGVADHVVDSLDVSVKVAPPVSPELAVGTLDVLLPVQLGLLLPQVQHVAALARVGPLKAIVLLGFRLLEVDPRVILGQDHLLPHLLDVVGVVTELVLDVGESLGHESLAHLHPLQK